MKKIVCLLCAAVLMVSLVACGESGGNDPQSENNGSANPQPGVNADTGEVVLNEPLVLVKSSKGNGNYFEYFYDAYGRIVKKTVYSNSQPYDELLYTYTEGADGTMICQALGTKTGTGEIYTYDADGYCVKRVSYSAASAKPAEEMFIDDRISVGYTYEYDSQKRLVKIVTINDEGEMSDYTDLAYDGAGNLVSRLNYGADGTFYGGNLFAYDEKGDMIKRTADGPANDSEYDYSWTYEKNGELLSQKKAGVSEFILNYSYDADGKPVRVGVTDKYGLLLPAFMEKDIALRESCIGNINDFMPLSKALEN